MSGQHHAASGGGAPQSAEPSLAERARTLAFLGRVGALSTHSLRFPGFPFGSVMPFAADALGRPVLLISGMAMHTQNLKSDARASLLVTQPDVSDDPLGAARLTLLGSAAPAPAGEVRDLYLSRHENAAYWQDFADFSYYRLEIEGVYFIGGFGVMGWVSAEDYAAARPDPMAESAPELMRRFNAGEPQALRSIAGYFLGETADEAAITALDRLGFHLRVRSGDRVQGRRIAFPHEITSARSAEAMLAQMAAEAQGAGLG